MRYCRGRPLDDVALRLVRGDRAGKIALLLQHVADPLVADAEIVLPARVAWI
jgi:hypothetical protein